MSDLNHEAGIKLRILVAVPPRVTNDTGAADHIIVAVMDMSVNPKRGLPAFDET